MQDLRRALKNDVRIGTDSRGFGLIGAIFGASIVTISMLATLQLLSRTTIQAHRLDTKFGNLQLSREVLDEMAMVSSCTAGLDRSVPFYQGSRYDLRFKIPNVATPIVGKPQNGTSGQGTELPDYLVKVNEFYLKDAVDTGIKTKDGLSLIMADVVLETQSLQAQSSPMRNPILTQLYLQVDGTTIRKCSTGDDPYIALLSACDKVGGVYQEDTLKCDMSSVQKAIVERSKTTVTTLLYGDYYNYLMSAAGERITAATGRVYQASLSAANTYTDQNSWHLNNVIGANTSTANTNVAVVNNTLNTNVNQLWAGLNEVNRVSGVANQLVNQSNSYANYSNEVSNNANVLSNHTNTNSAAANSISNWAANLTNQANERSAAANQLSAESNWVSSVSNGTAAVANNYSNNANSVSGAANQRSNEANGTVSSAINVANSAWAVLINANAVSTAANDSAHWANIQSNSATATTNQANSWSDQGNYWSNASLARPSSNNYYSNTIERNCNYGPISCANQ